VQTELANDDRKVEDVIHGLRQTGAVKSDGSIDYGFIYGLSQTFPEQETHLLTNHANEIVTAAIGVKDSSGKL